MLRKGGVKVVETTYTEIALIVAIVLLIQAVLKIIVYRRQIKKMIDNRRKKYGRVERRP